MNTAELQRLLNIGIALSANTDSDSLMREIVDVAMDLTDCDAGTLYILEEDRLVFHIMVTLSMGIDQGGHGQKITLPPVALQPKNVCARAALEKKLYSIKDVYEDQEFDFSGPRKYDQITGYETRSMLVIPMLDDRGESIGVLQLLNAKDSNGKTVPFPKDCEQVIQSLASQAAIRLTNLNYSREIKKLLESIVQVLSTAIDEMSPYNANHARNMAKYGERFLAWLRDNHADIAMDEQAEKEFMMAVWLHDIGKLVTPLEVMDKATRLGDSLRTIEQRFERIELLGQIRSLQGETTQDEYRALCDELKQVRELIHRVNQAGFLPDDLLSQVKELATLTYIDRDGQICPWLLEEEMEALTVRKGTLTSRERHIMENHVVMTEKMLKQMHFSKDYSHVTRWASNHHEFLNGTGYPHRLQGEELSFQERLMTILDVFDALTAKDRPYKKSMPEEQAFRILHNMAKDGQLDEEILALYEQSSAWEERMQEDEK